MTQTAFGIPELGDPGFDEALSRQCKAHLEEARKLLDSILLVGEAHTRENTLEPFNLLNQHLDAAGSAAGLMASVHPNKAVRDAAEACEKEVSRFSTELGLNRKLFEVFSSLKPDAYDAVTARLISKVLLDFHRSGVDKDEKTRDRIRVLNERLVELGQQFERNIREDVRFIELEAAAELEGLPRDYIEGHKPGANGKIRISTDYPDYVPFMSYAKSSTMRKRLSELFKNRAYPKNAPVFTELLTLRHELARLLGYPNWAAYVTEDKMIRTDRAVGEFIEEVSKIAEPRAKAELSDLLAELKKTDPSASEVRDWDKTYLEERVKVSKYAFDSREVRPYFEFKRVKDGLLELAGELFALHFERVLNPQVWHESVEVYDVIDRDKKQKLGRIYLDLHPRADKFKHAAQFTLRSGVQGRQVPEGVLVCNFPDPKSSSGGPALMEHGDVVTFFHEFGHLLHHVLGGHQKWIRFSGVATEWDFVEAPSQFFEEWAWDPGVLRRFAKHVESGEPIPEAVVARMREADEFGQGVAARQQMFYAALSLRYHSGDPSGFDATELLKATQNEYSLFPYQEGTYFYLNFGHLNGYSAMYYTYMWSQVIAKDLLSVFKKEGMMNLQLAKRYRKAILEPGGSKDAGDLVKDFLGRPYSFDAFKKWLLRNDS